MRVYAVVVTVLLVITAAAAGWLYSERANAQQSLDEARKQRADAEQRLKDLEDGIQAVKVTSQALVSVVDAPIIPGEVKIDRIEAASATEARQKIGDIPDQKDREQALKMWDDFRDSGKVINYQAILRTLSESLARSLQPKQ